RSWGWIGTAPTWTGVPLRSATRWARAAPALPYTCSTHYADGAAGTASAPRASEADRAWPSSSRPGPPTPEERLMELLLPLLLAAVFYSFVSLRVVRQYERGVAF